MNRRPGVTLVEVLVAIFIMAIAMLALLALFPLGALSMAQALKDDRCATAAFNAEGIAIAQDIRHDVAVVGGTWGTTTFQNAFVSPWATNLWTPPNLTDLTQAAGYTGPSFGVIVDPFMFPQDTTNQSVGPLMGVTPGVPRRSLVFSTNYGPATAPLHPNVLSATEAARWCSMLDGVTWVRGDGVGNNGVADGSQGSVLRDGRYTWAWLIRRPVWYADAVIDMSVIIFSGRPTTQLTGEPTFATAGAQGGTSVTIDYSTTGVKPSVRSGGWILDVTPTTVATSPAGPPVQVVYGYPYRVVSATDTGATQVTLELQTPLRNQVTAVTVLEYAVEVIDRGSYVQP